MTPGQKTCVYILILFIKITNCFAFEMYFLFQRICAQHRGQIGQEQRSAATQPPFTFFVFRGEKVLKLI